MMTSRATQEYATRGPDVVSYEFYKRCIFQQDIRVRVYNKKMYMYLSPRILWSFQADFVFLFIIVIFYAAT